MKRILSVLSLASIRCFNPHLAWRRDETGAIPGAGRKSVKVSIHISLGGEMKPIGDLSQVKQMGFNPHLAWRRDETPAISFEPTNKQTFQSTSRLEAR